ncbi:MAG: 30S ribosomal protein S27ae [Candidatus ainarchaeum sp.]|nr:30S ribosomal protein S27ae [Candidatus ainarchaeum sp.]
MAEKKQKTKKSKKYSITGDTIKINGKFCPKCGAGIFMAAHKDRNACGKCGYTEKK